MIHNIFELVCGFVRSKIFLFDREYFKGRILTLLTAALVNILGTFDFALTCLAQCSQQPCHCTGHGAGNNPVSYSRNEHDFLKWLPALSSGTDAWGVVNLGRSMNTFKISQKKISSVPRYVTYIFIVEEFCVNVVSPLRPTPESEQKSPNYSNHQSLSIEWRMNA